MNWKKRALLATALVMIPVWGGAWRAYNWHDVFAVSKTVFEVIGRPGSGAADYWCGAGDYVRHALRQPATTRIYIWRAIGPSVVQSKRKAVQFSMAPPENATTSPGYSLSVKAVGDNLTAAAAFQYCLGGNRFDPFVPRGW
jgi:hypothetical protein